MLVFGPVLGAMTPPDFGVVSAGCIFRFPVVLPIKEDQVNPYLGRKGLAGDAPSNLQKYGHSRGAIVGSVDGLVDSLSILVCDSSRVPMRSKENSLGGLWIDGCNYIA